PQGLGADVARCERDRVARHHGGPGREGPHGVGHPARVTGRDVDVLDADAELLGADLGEDRLVALALRRQTRRLVDPPTRLDLDVTTLLGPPAGALDVAADPQADLAALGLGLRPVLRDVVAADELLELVETRREVSRVVLE